jgi:type IV pilus assembly protein PilC
MLQAKMPLLRCLEVLARQQQPGRFRTAVADMVETVRTGGSLSEAMVKHPRIFEPLYLNMVRAGESSGALVVVMLRLSEFLEKSHKVRGKVKSAMTYPLIIMAVAAAVVSALIVFVVPSFESIFANMLKGQSLPVLTQAVLGFSQLVQANIWVTLAVTVAIFWGGRWVLRTPLGSNAWDRSVVRIPFIGDLVLKAAVARFTRTLGTLLSSNVKILDALRITRDTAGNSRVAGAIMAVHDRVKAGEGIASPLAETKVFPELVPSMIAVGEETGELPAMLDRVADSYEDEVDNAVAALTSILEPVMIVLMAVVVGIVVVALFLPLVSMIQNLS